MIAEFLILRPLPTVSARICFHRPSSIEMSKLSKILFPGAARDVRRSEMRSLVLWVVLGLLLSAAVTALFYFSNQHAR